MEFENYTRKPFPVRAAQVTMENVDWIAEQCGGKVEQAEYKIAGTKAKLPCVMVPSKDQKNRTTAALIGNWVVEMNGSWRVYKTQQFEAAFDRKVDTEEHAEVGLIPLHDEWLRLHATQTDQAPAAIVESRSSDYFKNLGNQHSVNNELIAGELAEFVKSATFEVDNWVEIVNEVSDRYESIGSVKEVRDDGLVSVYFEISDETLSFMNHELKKVSAFNYHESVRVKNHDETLNGWTGRVYMVSAEGRVKVRFDGTDAESWYDPSDLESFVSV